MHTKRERERENTDQLLDVGEQPVNSNFLQQTLISLKVIHQARETQAHALHTFLVLEEKHTMKTDGSQNQCFAIFRNKTFPQKYSII